MRLTRILSVLSALSVVTAVQADPMALRIVNNDPAQTVEAARVCMDDLCREVDVTCGPGQTCTLPALPYPLGCYDLRAQVRAGSMWSPPSEVLRNVAFSGPLCHDANADGRVSMADFGSFAEAWRLTR